MLFQKALKSLNVSPIVGSQENYRQRAIFYAANCLRIARLFEVSVLYQLSKVVLKSLTHVETDE